MRIFYIFLFFILIGCRANDERIKKIWEFSKEYCEENTRTVTLSTENNFSVTCKLKGQIK